jgi:regulator of sigma E protease
MELLITVIGAVVAVFIVILLHEAGHFGVAKAFGVKILRFSIGFGKPLWSHVSRSGTEYVLAILPLGGYVKMLDDREMHVSRAVARHAYNRQPLLVRMAIVLAGPFTNFLLAIFVFWIIFLLGISYVKPVIGRIVPESAAQRAGLQAGDTIEAIDGRRIDEWQQVLTALIKQIGNSQPLQIQTQPPNGQPAQVHLLSLQDWKLAGNQPDPLNSLGIIPFQPEFPAVIAKVLPHSPAARQGLQVGDQIVQWNQQPIADWPALTDHIRNHPNQEVSLTIKQGQNLRQVNIQLDSQGKKGQPVGYLGIEAKMPSWPQSMLVQPHYSILTAWQPAVLQTARLTQFNAMVLAKMITGKISLQTLGGPITIFRSAGQASQAGLRVYLSFIAFISIALGFINILPIPGLDGGHFLFQVIEGIIRRPISEKNQAILLRMGIVLIILLIIQGTVNDLMRLF